MSEDNEFQEGAVHISLPEGVDRHDVSGLLNWTADWFRKAVSIVGPLHVSTFGLQKLPRSDEAPSIYAEFWYKDKEALKQEVKSLKWRSQNKISPNVIELEFFADPTINKGLNYFVQMLPQDDNQTDISMLLDHVADTVRSLGKADILDVVVYDYSDKDAIDHPIARVYFVN